MTTDELNLSDDARLMGADPDDRADFDASARGFLGSLEPMSVATADGRVVWEMDSWSFLTEDRPDTVHPSLWRQAQLTSKHGLYEVMEGIYQVRGFDMSNMTLVEGDSGVVVIDPLISSETAAAALALYRDHRGPRPVTAVIYTHAHLDHFGGVLGVVEADTDVPIVAPDHFLEHAVSENVYAGTAMLRRSYYYAAPAMAKGPTGTLGVGLGAGGSTGTVGLIAPTLTITHTGQEEVLDGVKIVFQMTPGTECPAEMNFYFPDKRALCMSENATHNLHNLLTLRGAQVRDPRTWSRYLAEAIELFAHTSDVAFASHHWPTWGTAEVVAYLVEQRDLYAYLHDQTLRLINQGYVHSEIADMLVMPPALDRSWHTHGYYGSINHNAKAIYQRYLGWYDGNPAHLWQHPPEASGQRYAEAFGGIDALVAQAAAFAERGDLRFAAELASHAVFAQPDHQPARLQLADVLEQLGFGAENATWRNSYLTGALELRSGTIEHTDISSAGLAPALTITQLFDAIGIRVVGSRAWEETLSITWVFTDSVETYWMELSNGALIHYPTTTAHTPDLTVTLTKTQLLHLLATGSPGDIDLDGDASTLTRLMGLTDAADPDFAIVTP
ncbi:MAG: alkyl sulfatase dimerization domain-containing protein [Propionibacteriaceae bacterium]